MNEVLLIVGMMAVTFFNRYVLFAFANRISLPKGVQKALGYVPIAVLSAIIAPVVLMPKGEFAFTVDNAYLIAAIVAIVISWWRKNMLLTVFSGMTIFALMQYFS